MAGTDAIQVHQRPWGKAAGAICYDYDFPKLAQTHAQGGAGMVLVPSADWRSIDPHHTLMARLRAIEAGLSVVRPVQAATSMMFNAYGQTLASMSNKANDQGIFIASVPTQAITTVYSQCGDWPVILAVLSLLLVLLAIWQNKQQLAELEEKTNRKQT